MDSREIFDLVAAWLILGAAFANLLGGLKTEVLALALATAGIGFLLHELAHRIVARRFNLRARFQASYRMLGLAFLLSFAGFIFAAPGAVYTSGNRSGNQQAAISVAGPVTNILLALMFLKVPGQLGSYGFQINAWLALFNMIPVGGLDGQSVYRHQRGLFYAVIGFSAFLVFVL